MILDLYEKILQKYPDWIWDRNVLDLIEDIQLQIPWILNDNNKKNEIYKKFEWNK
jgi:hypothetical protein